MAERKIVRATPASWIFGVVALAVIAWLTTIGFGDKLGGSANVRKLTDLFILVALAQLWNLLAGYAGVVSVGQQAFVGLGAYGMIAFHNLNKIGLYKSILLSAVVAMILSIPLGLIAFRLRGSYFAIGTWVIADVARLFMKNNTKVGGGSGASIKVTGYTPDNRAQTLYFIALAVAVVSILLTWLLLRSKFGLQLQAIRDNESGARGLGANVYRTRFMLWVVVALLTGLAGATQYTKGLRVQPDQAFSVVQWTAPIIFIVVIGGLGTIEGPIIGAVAYWWFREWFDKKPTVLGVQLGREWYFIILGIVAVVFALFVKRGIWGVVRRFADIQLFPIRRRLQLAE